MWNNIKKYLDFKKSKEIDNIYITGVIIIVISHFMHLFDPEHHVYFQILFVIGYLLLATQPIWKGEKVNIYQVSYKIAIVILVTIAIILDNTIESRKAIQDKDIKDRKEEIENLKERILIKNPQVNSEYDKL